MWEITSMGEISAARTTMPCGEERVEVDGDFRTDLTTSLTPRLRILDLAPVEREEWGE